MIGGGGGDGNLDADPRVAVDLPDIILFCAFMILARKPNPVGSDPPLLLTDDPLLPELELAV